MIHNYTSVISGYDRSRLLRVRYSEPSVAVWRREPGTWCWFLLVWDEGGRSWARQTGESVSYLMAVGDGLAALDTEFRSVL